MENFSLRVPDQWAGLVNSVRVQRWLSDFFEAPRSLPADPGPGQLQISLSLPPRAVRVLSAGLGEPVAVALRRLSALNLGFLPSGGRELVLPAVTVSELSSWSAPSPECGESTEGPGYGRSEQPKHAAASEQYDKRWVNAEITLVGTEVVAQSGWWAELPFEMLVTLIVSGIFLLLIVLLSGHRRREALPASSPRPEFQPWTPVGS
jgi:hypothetical protein